MAEEYVALWDVQERLDAEAARIDAAHGGSHRFNNIRRYNHPSGANWTANYGVRGGTVSLRNAVMLPEMQASLQRIQAEMPLIRFEAGGTAPVAIP